MILFFKNLYKDIEGSGIMVINPNDEKFKTVEGFDFIISSIMQINNFKVIVKDNNIGNIYRVYVYKYFQKDKNFFKKYFCKEIEYEKILVYSNEFKLPEEYMLLNNILLDLSMVYM